MKHMILVSLYVASGIGPTLAVADDTAIRKLIADHGLQPLQQTQSVDSARFELGRSLFFDRELSGNRDVSCATCHHPSTSSGDSRALPSGVLGQGLGPLRTQDANREVIPRNAPEIFHRGNEQWTTLFWDSRVAEQGSELLSPAGHQLPAGFENVLQVQAMFPVTSRAEMRGNVGDVDIHGQPNEIAAIANDDFIGIWNALRDRLMAIPAYKEALEDAFPEIPDDELGYQHAAQAIADFEAGAFSPNDSAWDRYLAGDNDALSAAAKRGAEHFYSGSCVSCHSGDLLTDQQHHNLAVPQLGPGKDETDMDIGRALVTGEVEDEFRFRTPPLRNVTLTGPWMHNGAYSNLEDVIRHKYDPVRSLEEYDIGQLPDHLQATARLDQDTIDWLTTSIDPMLPIGEELTDAVVDDLMAFLAALTTPSADLMLDIVPDEVLSGLAVEVQPPSGIDVMYDPSTGALSISGSDSRSLDALFLRISDDEHGPAGFAFNVDAAPWLVDPDVTLSNLPDAQSFLEYRTQPEFLFAVGDEINSLLPAGLDGDEISDHFAAVFRRQGSPVLWSANVLSVPEPYAARALMLVGVSLLTLWRRRNSRPRPTPEIVS